MHDSEQKNRSFARKKMPSSANEIAVARSPAFASAAPHALPNLRTHRIKRLISKRIRLNLKAMSDVFQFLTGDDLRLLAERARHISYGAGDVVLREGSPTPGIFVLRSGRVLIEKRPTGQAQHVATLVPGEVFGEVSFIDNHPASATVIALDACEVDILDKTDVHSLLASVPGLSSRFYQSLAVKLAERLRTTTDNLTHV